MTDSLDTLRLEIAAVAARLVAEAGLDYGSAKHKAAREVLPAGRPTRDALPDNDQVDAALREHLDLFDPGHDGRVRRRRSVAAELMGRLDRFHPYLTGAVWKGVVAEHAPIHLEVFVDDPKEVEIFLLNEGLRFEVGVMPHVQSPRREIETLAFEWRNEPVLLSLYAVDDIRGALRAGAGQPPARGDRRALAALDQVA